MKSILLLLALSSFGFAQSQKSRPSGQDSLSLPHVHKLDAGPQVGVGLGVGKGSMFFLITQG